MKNLSSRGFTMLELMAAIAVAAVILGLAVPSFTEFSRNSEMSGSANDVLAALHAARSEAIKRQVRVVMCFADKPDTAPDCDGDGSKGWIVFLDDDNDVRVDAGETILINHGALPTTLSVKSSRPSGNKGYVSFQSSGFATTVSAVGQPVASFVLCDKRGNVAKAGGDQSTARAIEISNFGRPSVSRSVSAISALGGCP